MNDQLSYYVNGKPIFSNLSDEIHQAFSHHYSFQLMDFRRELPGTVVIHAKLVEIAYIVEQDGQKWSIDHSGGVHPFSDQVLPTVQTVGLLLQESSTLQMEVHEQLVQLTETLKKLELPDTTINWISNSEIRLRIPEDKTVIVKLENLHAQIELFQKLREYPFEKEDWSELDLRFEKPILR